MRIKRPINHAKRVGRTANLVIFLGILSIILSTLALTISQELAKRGYGLGYIAIGLVMIGFGYGIRYRYKYCLYLAIMLFTVITGNLILKFSIHHTTYLILRLTLCGLASFRLIQSASSMRVLIATNTFPEKYNRYMELFLRRRRI